MEEAVEYFNSPTKGPMSLEDVVTDLTEFIKEEPERSYTLIVGSDSEQDDDTSFVSVIVIHRIGRHARYFWKRTHEANMPSLRQRIYHEATLSLALAQRLTEAVGDALNGYLLDGTCLLEVHVDIGQVGKTRDMIKEIVGMVRGSGFFVRIKPEAYAASCVADKHV